MKLQQEMYSEVEKWKSSGQSRADFVKGKAFTLSKFNYRLNRYRKENIKSNNINLQSNTHQEITYFYSIKTGKSVVNRFSFRN